MAGGSGSVSPLPGIASPTIAQRVALGKVMRSV